MTILIKKILYHIILQGINYDNFDLKIVKNKKKKRTAMFMKLCNDFETSLESLMTQLELSAGIEIIFLLEKPYELA